MGKLFEVGKIGAFLDAITHGSEKRPNDGRTKIVTCTLRVDPFDVTHALALDQRVRDTLYSLSTSEKRAHLRRAEFALGISRQNIHIFAAPDTAQASRVITQVAVKDFVAKIDKDKNHFSLTFKIAFGPVDRDELALIEDWRTTQRFLTFEEAEPSLAFDTDDDTQTDDDEMEVIDGRQPAFDDGTLTAAAPESEEAREKGSRTVKPRGTRKKTKRHDPDAEKRAQAVAGKAAAVAH